MSPSFNAGRSNEHTYKENLLNSQLDADDSARFKRAGIDTDQTSVQASLAGLCKTARQSGVFEPD
ncbi:hypothetical protein, partial [Pseudomonas syringae]|uniref:hypothetical protein n=1 Tax=Pseudomonas syringae TaxID=317 RepID=UPI001F401167